MAITDVFDAVREGTYKDFKKCYKGNINEVDKYTKLDLLSTAVLNDLNPDEKIKIIEFLLSKKISVDFADKKFKRNAFHHLFFCFNRGLTEHILRVAKLLYENGMEINGIDKFGAIPLKYAITISKLPTNEMRDIYMYLLKCGSNYELKDQFGKSCLDYAKEYSWRNDFLNIVKEYEDGKQE